MGLDNRAFRDCLGCFATGVAIITGRGSDGLPAGLTVNSFASVSLDPALVLWSLDKRSPSVRVFTEGKGFLAHILAEDQTELSRRFSRPGAHKWTGLATAEGAFGAPLIPGAHAVLECESHAAYAGGDHMIFLGRVTEMRVDAEKKPLIFYRGQYRELAA